MIIIYLTVVFLSLLALHVAVRYNKVARTVDKIPGPAPLSIFGNLLMFNVSLEKMWTLLLQTFDDYYPIVRFWLFTNYAIVVRHPDDIKAILLSKKCIDKCDLVYGTFESIGNDGLVTNGGEKWRRHRKIVNPAFTPNLLKVYCDIINEHVERLIKDIKNQNEEIMPDLISTFSKVNLEIICEATMGVDPNDFGVEKAKVFRSGFGVVSEMIMYRMARPYIQDWMIKYLSSGRKHERTLKVCREFVAEVIQERREYHKKSGYEKFQNIVSDLDDGTYIKQSRRLSVLDLLLVAERQNLIDAKGVADETETFLIAGSETTSIAIALLFMLMAENKAVQDLARGEVTEVLKQTQGVLTMADMHKLDYVERCIKETLRLYPSAPIIGRAIKENMKLSNYEIPLESQVFMSIISLHRDPNFWPDPDKFDPDRFLPENVQKRHPYAYVPFSGGLRTCIGYKLAINEMKTVLAHILHNFYIEPVDLIANMKITMGITITPTDPCRVKLIKINGN